MQVNQGSLTILDAHTQARKVYWDGQEVPCLGIAVDNDDARQRVVITVAEDPTLAEMQAAGDSVSGTQY